MSYTTQLLVVMILPPLIVVGICWLCSVINGVRQDIEDYRRYNEPSNNDDRNV